MTIQMLKTQKRVGIVIHIKLNIGLVRSTMFPVMLCCLFVALVFLVTEAVTPKVLHKNGTPKSSAEPTGKHLRQRLLFNKEETRGAEMWSTVKSAKPSKTSLLTKHLRGMLL